MSEVRASGSVPKAPPKGQPMTIQMLTISGRKFALLPMREFERLRQKAGAGDAPALPPILPSGNYPAREALQAVYARKLARERHSAGLTQSELARRAGLRTETISRLENGKHSPDMVTVGKITRALRAAGAKF